MLNSVVRSVAFAAIVVAGLGQSAQASWLFDDNLNQGAGWQHSAGGASARHGSRQVASEEFAGQEFGRQEFGRQSLTRQVRDHADIPSSYEGMVAQYASANGVPTSLVHRVIMRESRYNPRAVSMGNYGIMQIRLSTARAMGYSGSAAGLLDAETNMTYAVRYLAGAYKAAHGNETLAVALYARGYNARPYNAAEGGF